MPSAATASSSSTWFTDQQYAAVVEFYDARISRDLVSFVKANVLAEKKLLDGSSHKEAADESREEEFVALLTRPGTSWSWPDTFLGLIQDLRFDSVTRCH